MEGQQKNLRMKIIIVIAIVLIAAAAFAAGFVTGYSRNSADDNAVGAGTTAEDTTEAEAADTEALEAETAQTEAEETETAQTDASYAEETDGTTAQDAGDSGTASSAITADQAKAVAIADCGLSSSEIKYVNIWKDKEDGTWVYCVEFGTYDDTEYKYVIDMYTGLVAASYIEQH